MDEKMIGKRIRKIRTTLGMTMKEFGLIFDPPASDSLVSRWERGINAPNRERMKKIAEHGNVTVDHLINGKNMYLKLSDDSYMTFENFKNISNDLENELNMRLERLENKKISPFAGSTINELLKVIEDADFNEVMDLNLVFHQISSYKKIASKRINHEEKIEEIHRRARAYEDFLLKWAGYKDEDCQEKSD